MSKPSGVKWKPPTPHKELPEDIDDQTRCIATSLSLPGKMLQPVVEPIHLTKTYEVDTPEEFAHFAVHEGRYVYQRLWNRTTEALELCVAELEESAGCLMYTSGISALSSLFLTFLQPGDHIVSHEPMYSGLHKILQTYLPRFQITTTTVPAGSSMNVFRAAIQHNTKMLIGETPCNPDTSVLDIKEFAELGKELNIMTCIDGTFASPYLQKVIPLGIDFSVHSCSKYMGGHDDVIAGCISTRTLEQFQILKMSQFSFSGASLGPFEAYQVHRGMKTLGLRMERHSENAMKLARVLEKHPNVNWVLYPGLESHPGHHIAKKQMKLFGGMMAFEVKGEMAGARKFITNLKIAHLTAAIGGVETCVNNPFIFSHGPLIMNDEERKKARVTEGLIRLSVGLENPDDLIKDFIQALDGVTLL